MSGFQRHTEEGSAARSAVRAVPLIFPWAWAAARGMPRMMWMPNFSPRPWTYSARGAKPLPPAEEGKRSGSGRRREYSSISSTPKGMYWNRSRMEPGLWAYHWISTTTYSQPKGRSFSAITWALARTWASVTEVS